MNPATEIDTTNKFLVSVSGARNIIILNPPRGPMSREEALTFAAWIVALADEGDFALYRSAVERA